MSRPRPYVVATVTDPKGQWGTYRFVRTRDEQIQIERMLGTDAMGVENWMSDFVLDDAPDIIEALVLRIDYLKERIETFEAEHRELSHD